ncbi:DUF4922 domain-containing protein [Sunxiuqinia sp. A32]|uniref:DUF4922 domain-containing protein n=1 Tax=Sunxiuqinia sp. A32 TaxID=3461496 RepID=UPI0040454E6B
MSNPYLHTEKQNLHEKVEELIKEQTSNWPLAKRNYSDLKKIESKSFGFQHCQIQVQFNPERIRSSAAKVDAKSISERPCFLCESNRPPEQNYIDLGDKYSIRINPFPIFEKHLTISLNQHVPQEIEPYFVDMLEISQLLPAFTIFYNGPKCGASAPDHFHFQAVGKNQLPVERELKNTTDIDDPTVINKDEITIQYKNSNYLRKVLVYKSSSKEKLKSYFKRTLSILKERDQDGEPMMNVLANFEENEWNLFLFPRDLQRPSQYFEKGEKQLVMSPASVEMGGLVILPREEDFEKITSNDLADIYKQVTINDLDFKKLIEKLKR